MQTHVSALHIVAIWMFVLGHPSALSQPATTATIDVASGAEIVQSIRDSSTPFTLVNVWATWCSPCLEEFPELVKLARDTGPDSVNVVFISLDFPEDLDIVREFLEDFGWDRHSYIRDDDDADFVNGFIPEWSGTVPSTFIYNESGSLIFVHDGMTTREVVAGVLEGAGS